MGDAARRAYLRRTTPEQRFDDGLRLSEAMIRAVLSSSRAIGSPRRPSRGA